MEENKWKERKSRRFAEPEALLPSHFKLENHLPSARLQQGIGNCPGYKGKIKDGRVYDRREMNNGQNPSPGESGANPRFLLDLMKFPRRFSG